MSARGINPLEEAEKLLKKRKWASVISLLEPLKEIYRESNPNFFVMLGSAYLYSEDIGNAYSCFRRAYYLKHNNVNACLGLAAVQIRRGNVDKAVQVYIDLIGLDPNCKKANRGLEILKKTEDLESLQTAKIVKSVYPTLKRNYVPLILVLCAIAIVSLLVVFSPKLYSLFKPKDTYRPGISEITLSKEELEFPVGTDGAFKIVLTDKEAVQAFNDAKQFFSSYRDEKALVELNRIRISNASRFVKAKAEELAMYVRTPSFTEMPDRFTFDQVNYAPELYENVGIIWKGMPADIVNTETEKSFNFLVGYQDKSHIDDIIHVTFNFECEIVPDKAIEILAKVKNKEKGFYLECLAIHELQN